MLTREEKGAEALRILGYDFSWTGYQVSFHPGRKGLLGMTMSEGKRIEVYVRDSHTPADVARTLAHEVGHAIDLSGNTPEEMDLYRSVRGIPASSEWYECDWSNPAQRGCSDVTTPAGDFAETFAVWSLGARSQGGWGQPTRDELRAVEHMFRP